MKQKEVDRLISPFDVSGPSILGAKMQLEADRSRRVSKFGQRITIESTVKNSSDDFNKKRIVHILENRHTK